MNRWIPVVAAFLLACMTARGQGAPLSDATRNHLKPEIHFDASLVRDEKELPFELGDEVVELPALTVTESIRRRDLEAAIERSQREAEERKFSLIRGGTLYTKEFRRAKLELGTWSVAGGIGFLKLSW